MTHRLAALVLSSLLAVLGVGCSAAFEPLMPDPSSAMHPASGAAHVVPRDRALVVFLRPTYWGAIYSLRILDENGHFVADVPAHAHAVVALPPGDHVFTAIGRELEIVASRKNVLFARLEPGRVYFVELAIDLEGPKLEALRPTHEDWGEVRAWLDETKELAPNDDALGKSIPDGEKIVTEALERSRALTAAEIDERTLHAEEGVASF